MVEDCWEWLTQFISYHSLKTALWCIHLSISKLDDYSMHDSGRTTPVSVTIYYGSQNVSHCPSSWEKFKGWAMMTYRCRSLLADIKGTSPPWDIVLKVHVYIQCGQKCLSRSCWIAPLYCQTCNPPCPVTVGLDCICWQLSCWPAHLVSATLLYGHTETFIKT